MLWNEEWCYQEPIMSATSPPSNLPQSGLYAPEFTKWWHSTIPRARTGWWLHKHDAKRNQILMKLLNRVTRWRMVLRKTRNDRDEPPLEPAPKWPVRPGIHQMVIFCHSKSAKRVAMQWNHGAEWDPAQMKLEIVKQTLPESKTESQCDTVPSREAELIPKVFYHNWRAVFRRQERDQGDDYINIMQNGIRFLWNC